MCTYWTRYENCRTIELRTRFILFSIIYINYNNIVIFGLEQKTGQNPKGTRENIEKMYNTEF